MISPGVLRESVINFIASFKFDHNEGKVCYYNVITDMKRMGLLYYDISQKKYDPISYCTMSVLYYTSYPELIRLLLMIFFLDPKTSFHLCDHSALVPQYRWALLSMVTTSKLILCAYLRIMKNACKDPKQLKWLQIYLHDRRKGYLKFIPDLEWDSFHRTQNRIYLICWWFFRIIIRLSLFSVWSSPFYFPEGRCSPSVWVICSISVIHITCCLCTLSALFFIMASYNHILRYRLDEILRSLKRRIQVTDDFILNISASYLQVYCQFENSRKVLCQLMGSTFFGIFGLTLNVFILYLTTETVFQLKIFSIFSLTSQISVIFLLGIIVVHLSSVKDQQLRKSLRKILSKGSLKPSTKSFLIELESMITARPIVYGCFDIFRLTTMNVFKFYQETAAWMMLLATSLKI